MAPPSLAIESLWGFGIVEVPRGTTLAAALAMVGEEESWSIGVTKSQAAAGNEHQQRARGCCCASVCATDRSPEC